jgi:hypothetical protein
MYRHSGKYLNATDKENSYLSATSTSSFSCFALLFLFPTSCLAILYTRMLLGITLAKQKCFGLVDVGDSWLKGNTAAGSDEEASSSDMHATFETPFLVLTVVISLFKVDVMCLIYTE